MQTGDHIPLGAPSWIGIAERRQECRCGSFNARFCWNRDIEIGDNTALRRFTTSVVVACQPFLDECRFPGPCGPKNRETRWVVGGNALGIQVAVVKLR